MIWIALTGSVFSAWSMFRLIGHERDSRVQDMESKRTEAEGEAAPPTTAGR